MDDGQAVVAMGSGLAADSLTLTAFGIDSLIELASATVLVWRLTVELRHGQTFAECERTASRIGGAFCCLRSLPMWSPAQAGNYGCGGAEFSLSGLIICLLAIPIMYFLGPCASSDSPTRSAAAPSGLTRLKVLTCGSARLRRSGCTRRAVPRRRLVGRRVASSGVVSFLIREGREAHGKATMLL